MTAYWFESNDTKGENLMEQRFSTLQELANFLMLEGITAQENSLLLRVDGNTHSYNMHYGY
jgi:hypothetical protein